MATKAPPHSISCADCGATYETKRKNTRYCAVCRLRKDLLFITTRVQKCWDCGATFAPLNSDDVLCSECEPRRTRYTDGKCNVCSSDPTTLLIPGVAICTRCARAPELRPTIVQKLGSRIRWQKAHSQEAAA